VTGLFYLNMRMGRPRPVMMLRGVAVSNFSYHLRRSWNYYSVSTTNATTAIKNLVNVVFKVHLGKNSFYFVGCLLYLCCCICFH
jgi:hypothetical protein